MMTMIKFLLFIDFISYCFIKCTILLQRHYGNKWPGNGIFHPRLWKGHPLIPLKDPSLPQLSPILSFHHKKRLISSSRKLPNFGVPFFREKPLVFLHLHYCVHYPQNHQTKCRLRILLDNQNAFIFFPIHFHLIHFPNVTQYYRVI